jgi:hypothetical protein
LLLACLRLNEILQIDPSDKVWQAFTQYFRSAAALKLNQMQALESCRMREQLYNPQLQELFKKIAFKFDATARSLCTIDG